MTQHTPGPKWECLGTDDGALVICARDAHGKRRTVAHVYQEAHSRLIAKAPEMVELLHRFSDSGLSWPEREEAIQDARALLRELEDA